MKRKATDSTSPKSSSSSTEAADQELIQKIWDQMQPWALHPIQLEGLDSSLKSIFEFFNRPNLHHLWMKMYG